MIILSCLGQFQSCKIESRKSKESLEYLKVIIIWIELITIKTC